MSWYIRLRIVWPLAYKILLLFGDNYEQVVRILTSAESLLARRYTQAVGNKWTDAKAAVLIVY